MRKFTVSMITVAAAAFLLAGCGKSADDKKETSTAAAVTTAAEETTEKAAAEDEETTAEAETTAEETTAEESAAETETTFEAVVTTEEEAASKEETASGEETADGEEETAKEEETAGTEDARVRVIDIALTDELYAFGVDKEQPELLEKANEFIAQIMEDGTFDEVCNRNFGDGEPAAVKSAKLDESKDQLIVATNAAFEPFEYMKGEDYYGIDMEIAQLFAEYLGQELVIQNMDFDAVCLSVGQQKCDIAMAGLTINEKREEYVAFTDSYYNASQKLIVRADDTTFADCKSAEDIEEILSGFDSKVTIGVQTGTTGQFYVEGDEEWGFDGYEATCTGYKNGSLAVQDLINGNIDYVIIDSAPAACIVEAVNSL